MEKLLEIVLYLICSFTMAFLQAYVIHFIIKLFFKEKSSLKKLLISFGCFIPFCALAILFYIKFPELKLVKSLISISAVALTTFLLYRTNLLNTVIITFLNMIIPFIFEMIVVFFVTIFLRDLVDLNQLTYGSFSYYITTICMNVLNLIILLLIDYICKKKSNSNSTPININMKNIDYKTILYQGLIIILTLIPTMFLITSKSYSYPLSFIFVNTAQLLVVSIFSFFYIRKRMHFKDTELELENTKLHNQALSTINENIRGFKHDMGNMVQSINGYLAVGNIEGVKTYCKNLLHGFNDINLLSILSPKIINDPAIYGIVVSKMLYARDNNLTLSLDIGLDVSQINFPSFELSKIIGILLDNAIEASLDSDERKLKLEMYHEESRNRDVIIIGNSVKDANKVNIIKMFDKDYSTKENPSGFGLYEVLKFFKKNNKGDILPNIDYDKNFFTQTLTFDR